MFIYHIHTYLCMAVYLHYVGKVYTDSEFIKEGKKCNIQRLTSYSMVCKLVRDLAVIYYARYDKERGYARVFAKGKVIGYATTHPYLKEKIINEGYQSWALEIRGCGSCYTASYTYSNHIDMLHDLMAMRKDANKYRWFILTNIEPYTSSIDNIIEYKVRSKKMIVKDIGFTRGFICLSGRNYLDDMVDQLEGRAIKMHKLHNKNDYDDIRSKTTIDLSSYTQLDKWLGGVSC
jgi:hypothetical protein